MPARKVALPEQYLPESDRAELAAALAALRTELEIPDEFPAEVVAAAEAAAKEPRLPELDRTDLELITTLFRSVLALSLSSAIDLL